MVSVVAFFIIKRLRSKAIGSSEQLSISFTRAWYIMRVILLILPISFVLSFSFSLYLLLTNEGIIGLLVVALILISLLCWFTFGIYRGRPVETADELWGVIIAYQPDKKIWQLVNQIAEKLQLASPDHILLGIDKGFFITNNKIIVYPQHIELTGNTLYLAGSYLKYLTIDELSSVVAHELTHLANDDINLTKRIKFQLDSLTENIALLYQHIIFYPAALLSEHFFYSFNAAIWRWNRCRETLADANSVKVCSKAQVASALIKISMLTPQLAEALNYYYYQGYKNYLPLSFIAQHISQLDRPPIAQLLAKSVEEFDTHPTLAERLAALQLTSVASLNDQQLNNKPTHLIDELVSEELRALEPLYQKSISESVETDKKRFNNIVDSHQLTITLKQGGIIRLIVIAIIFMLSMIFTFTMLKSLKEPTLESIILVTIFLIITIFSLFQLVSNLQRIGSKLFTLAPEGLLLPCFDKVIPWDQIDDCYITTYLHSHLHFVINPTFQLVKPKRCSAKIKYFAQQNHIKLTVFDIKGKIMIQDCLALLIDYTEAFFAKKELQLFTDKELA